MDHDRVGTSCNTPPFFDESNYAAWSEKFQIFLEAQGLIVIDYLTLEWKAPSRNINGESVIKSKVEWSPDEVSSTMANRKARNAIVTAIYPTQFAHIRCCTTAKQAWDKLRMLHEGEKEVRNLKLQLTLSKFENLRMKELKSFLAF